MARSKPIDVYVERGAKRVFASAVDWPGWTRAGKDEAAALLALAAAAPRYAVVAAEAGVPLPAGDPSFEVVERVKGTATTDFGAPDIPARQDKDAMTRKQAERIAALVAAAWRVFDRVVAGAPAALRKGPRGGGRDRDKIFSHVLDAETAYGRKLGVRLSHPAPLERNAVAASRNALLDQLRAAIGRPDVPDKGWLPRYAARRIAWHVLDHAWEMEDRS